MKNRIACLAFALLLILMSCLLPGCGGGDPVFLDIDEIRNNYWNESESAEELEKRLTDQFLGKVVEIPGDTIRVDSSSIVTGHDNYDCDYLVVQASLASSLKSVKNWSAVQAGAISSDPAEWSPEAFGWIHITGKVADISVSGEMDGEAPSGYKLNVVIELSDVRDVY